MSKANSIKTPQQPAIVAKIGNENINLQELDTAIQFNLFDLEWRKYQLRKEMLTRMIVHRQQLLSHNSSPPASSEILLPPPEAPRIYLPRDKRPIKGLEDAPILMSVFCSYQSSHCARLQAVIKQLESHYGKSLAFIFYDLPQGFHRYGIPAANAFHCAEALGSPWDYQGALYSDSSNLNKAHFMRIAEQLGLTLDDFESCLDENRYHQNIKADISLATKLGLSSVPVMLINGLYTKGPQNFEAYRYYVDQELRLLGHDPRSLTKQNLREQRLSEQEATESLLPLTLLATTVSNEPSSSTALIRFENTEQGSLYHTGEQLLEQVKLLNIDTQSILIDNQGQLEFVKLQVSQGHDLSPKSSAELNNLELTKSNAEQLNLPKDLLERSPTDKPQRELPVTGEMILSKDWLDSQLIDQISLEAHFYLADHVVDGYHLVKLKDINDQRFYNTLGFKTGDVLLRVNDQWVHEGQNPLWDKLAKGEAVTVVLMRGGYPVRYDYKIQQLDSPLE